MGRSPLYYLAFIYIVSIALILLCDEWTKAAAVITIIAAMLTTTLCFVRLAKMHDMSGVSSAGNVSGANNAAGANNTGGISGLFEGSTARENNAQPSTLQQALATAENVDSLGYNLGAGSSTHDGIDQNPNTLGDDWEAHHVYNSTFDAVSGANVMMDSPAELAPDVDARNALMSGQRFQQKRSLDGAVTKTADYYKHNFAQELDEVEKKPWWGNSEF